MAVELAAPTIVEPLTPYVSAVRLLGLVPNSLVQIFQNNLTVGNGTATSTDQWFPLGAKLKAGQKVTARQGGSALAEAHVLNEPNSVADLPPLSPVSRTYKCASSTWVDGAYPGSRVTIVDTNNLVRGMVTTEDTDARLSIVPPLDFGPVSLLQADLLTGPFPKNAALVFPIPPDSPVTLQKTGERGKLPTPRITQDLHVCQSRVPVDGVIEGAVVLIRRYALVSTALHPEPHLELVAANNVDFDYPALWASLPKPLRLGEELTVQQHMPSCGLAGDESPRYAVREDVRTPTVSPIVCAKDRSVQVGNLVPDALVEIGVEGSDEGIFVMGASSDTASFPVPEDFLVEGMQIRFRQSLSCAAVAPIESAWSPSVAVQDLTSLALGSNPTIDPQPWSCGTKVRVRNVAPGSTVYVVSKKWGDRWSYAAQVPPDGKHQVDVDLFWGAMPDDTLTAEMVQCGQSTLGPGITVLTTTVDDSLRVPVIDSPVRDCGPVIVRNVVPGAFVEVYRIDNGVQKFHASVTTPLDRAYVDAPKELPIPPFPIVTTLVARQYVCRVFSPMSNPATMAQGSVSATAKYLARLNGGATQTKYGLAGMDLGIPVEHNGELLLFFGDSKGINPDKDVTAFKSVARASPVLLQPFDEPVSTLKLEFLTSYDAGADTLANPVHTKGNANPDLRVVFQVPSGGFSFEGRIYLFVTESDDSVGANPRTTKLTGDDRDAMARSYLISAPGPTGDFTSHFVVDAANWNYRFINVCPVVVDASSLSAVPGPWNDGPGVLVFGSGQYRESDVFLAWAPLHSGKVPAIEDPTKWFYLTSVGPFGPNFEDYTTGAAHAVGLLSGSVGSNVKPLDPKELHHEVGEFSVAWVPGINRWLMLYGGIGGAVASAPWGPWTTFENERKKGDPQPLWDWGVIRADRKDGSFSPVEYQQQSGGYGTYLLPGLNRWDVEASVASVYTTFSFLDSNAGTVHLARIALQCAK